MRTSTLTVMRKKTMRKPDPTTVRRRVVAAEAVAATLLLPPCESTGERQAARYEAARLILMAGELLVRGGCDELARAAHDLAGRANRGDR